jgi:hypothetical protein
MLSCAEQAGAMAKNRPKMLILSAMDVLGIFEIRKISGRVLLGNKKIN